MRAHYLPKFCLQDHYCRKTKHHPRYQILLHLAQHLQQPLLSYVEFGRLSAEDQELPSQLLPVPHITRHPSRLNLHGANHSNTSHRIFRFLDLHDQQFHQWGNLSHIHPCIQDIHYYALKICAP